MIENKNGITITTFFILKHFFINMYIFFLSNMSVKLAIRSQISTSVCIPFSYKSEKGILLVSSLYKNINGGEEKKTRKVY